MQANGWKEKLARLSAFLFTRAGNSRRNWRIQFAETHCLKLAKFRCKVHPTRCELGDCVENGGAAIAGKPGALISVGRFCDRKHVIHVGDKLRRALSCESAMHFRMRPPSPRRRYPEIERLGYEQEVDGTIHRQHKREWRLKNIKDRHIRLLLQNQSWPP